MRKTAKKTMRLILSLTIVFCISQAIAYAGMPEGIGYGKTESEAKKEALADLASIIKVRVYSKYEQTVTSENGDALVQSNRFTRLTTDVPILSPSVIFTKKGGEVIAVATIENIAAYTAKLSGIAAKIDTLNAEAANAANAEIRYRLLESAAPLYYEYDSYAAVPLVLGLSDMPAPKESAASVTNKLLALRTAPPSLEVAAEVLASPVTEKRVYVAPILASGSREVSPFAVFFGDMLSARLKGVKDIRESNYIYNCSYTPAEDGIIMSCALTSGTLIVKAATVRITKLLLAGADYGIKTKNVSSILNEYYKPAETLSVQLKIATDNDPLLIREGEEFTVLVKTSAPAYIYMAGYSASSANIIEMSSGKFAMRITPDEAGRWVSLGRFRASAPFGAETLQVFATEKEPDAADVLPKYARGDFGKLPVTPEKAAKDISEMFAAYKNAKASAYVTLTTVRMKP